MLNSSKIGYYFETILEIIEDKPNFIIPIYFYCILVQVLFHQIAGYIYSNFESKQIGEEKAAFIGHINEVSPLTFLLFFKGNDTLSLICFFIMQILMYFYFIYVGILTYIKNAKKYFFQQNQKAFRSLNQFLNVFFTFYWWLFFTPYIEINSGMLVCGNNSFLKEYRGGDCTGKSPIITILSVLGLILSVTTALIIVYFFRNYEFNEQNLLKRRFHYVIIAQLIGRFLLTFFYYLDLKTVLAFKHIIGQFIGVCFLYDTLINWPFSSHVVAKFYSCSSCIFEIAIILCNLWMFSDFLPGTEFFYYFVMLSLLTSALMVQTWRYKYESLMKIDEKNFNIYFKQTDFFLEEMVRLLTSSQKDEQAKFKLFETIIYHKEVCVNVHCHCKLTNFKKSNNNLNEEDVFRLVDSIFKWALRSRQLTKNSEEFEHLSLKYISYLAKYRDNTSRAYYELKVLLSMRKDISFYFKIISKILSRAIEIQMEQTNSKNTIQKEYREDLELSLVWKMEELKQEFIPKMVKALEQKVSFWEKMKQGFNKMEDCMQYAIKKIKFIEDMDAYFSLELSRMNGDQTKSYIFYKICSMFEMLVKNQIVNAMKLEINANELRKRDQSKPPDTIHNFKLAKQQIVSFLVSFAQERGKIVSKKTSFTARFFGYGHGEEDNLKSINDIMPKFISNIHNELMENMNWRGKSKYIKNSIRSYCSDKEGFIYPVKIFLDHSFGHFDDFCLLSSILKVNTSNDFIVFDQSGKILGISEQIFFKLFSNESKMNIQRMYRQGFIFIIFKEIMNQINQFRKEILSSNTDQQLVHLTPTNKGYFNLNQNFGQLFDLFNQFLEINSSQKMTDLSKTTSTKQTNKSQKMKMYHTLKNDVIQQKTNQIDLLSEKSYEMICQFFEFANQRKQELLLKGSISSDNGSQRLNDNNTNSQYQIRLFFKYQLQYEVLRYQENQKEQKLFHLVLSDLAISKRKTGQAFQSNMSLNTYVNSTQVGGGSSYRLKTFLSKGGDTDLGNSVKLSDEKLDNANKSLFAQKENNKNNQQQNQDKQQQHISQQDENILDTNHQFDNKFGLEEDNWTHTKKGMSDNGDDDEDEDNVIENKKQQNNNNNNDQNKKNDNSPQKSQKKNENLEYIQEVSNKDEDTAKQNSIKHQKSYENLDNDKTYNNIDNQVKNNNNKNNKQQQNQEQFQETNDRSNTKKNNILNESILNDSNMPLFNNNAGLMSNTNRNDRNIDLLSLSNRNEDLDETQRNILNQISSGGPINRQAEFFSPTNNMRQLLDNDEILITVEDTRPNELSSQQQPPFNIRFAQSVNNTQFNNPNIIQELTNQVTYQKQLSTQVESRNLGGSNLDQQDNYMKYGSQMKQLSMDDDMMKNENLDKDLERIKKNQTLKDSKKQTSLKIKKKKHSLKSENNIEDDGIQQQSMASHSSIRSSYGTQFVREILNQKRLPTAARSYNIVQKIFVLSFLIIIIVNIFFISNQISKVSNGMENYALYGNITNSCSKGVYSIIGFYELEQKLLTQQLEQNTIYYTKYLDDAANNFSLNFNEIHDDLVHIENDNDTLMNVDYTEYDYKGQKIEQKKTTLLELFYVFQNALKETNSEIQEAISQTSPINYPVKVSEINSVAVSFYHLRYNYREFIKKMQTLKVYQDDLIDSNIDNINSLYIIASVISCLISIMVVITSVPMIHKINLYKQKIILLVTRISVDDADIEIGKYKACIEHLNDSYESYLNVDFFKLFTSRRKFNRHHNPNGPDNNHTNSAKKLGYTHNNNNDNDNENMDENNENNDEENQYYNEKKSQEKQNSNNNKQQNSQQQLGNSQIKNNSNQKKRSQNHHSKRHHSSSDKNNNNNSGNRSSNKYKQNVISSKIFEQKLGLVRQFFSFLSFAFITIGFFIVILVYIIVKNNQYIPTLRISRTSINTQYSIGSLYVFSELLAVENQFEQTIQSYPSTQTLDYRKEMKQYIDSDMTIIQQFNQDNINNVYGNNVISSSSLSDLKDLYQNPLCTQFPTELLCKNFNEGISGYFSELFSLITSHNTVLGQDAFPNINDIKSYLQTVEHQKLLSESYIVPDHALSLFTAIIIDANVTLIQDMSQLIKIIFYTVGPLILIILTIFFFKQWFHLTSQLNSLSFLLTLIPEEKITEEITLQMLKQIRSF